MSVSTPYLFLFLSLLSVVLALPLALRDVVSPPITSPKAGTVWHVGQTQTVTWSTANLPVNQTNPAGKLILGYLYNDSENLMLDLPLATALNYSTGQAQITVPNVPTRSDYIIVLFGDSGNASPEFTIINDASSSTSVASSSPTTPPGSAPPATSTPDSGPSPSQGNYNPGSSDGSSPKPTSPTTVTTPKSQTTSRTSTAVVVTSSSTPSSTSAAWQKHVPGFGTSLSVAFALVYLAFS